MFAGLIGCIKNSDRYTLLLGLFYFVAHGGILMIPNAIYWDDWVLFRADPNLILDKFQQAGSMFNLGGYLHVALLGIGPWSYKLLTFILMFASGLMLNTVIKRYSAINEETRFFIVMLFLVLPFNMARVAIIDFSYTLCYFLFFLAWVLMDRFRILALALFFLSFNTNSLLVFYALPFFDMLYRSGQLSSWRGVLNFGLRHLDYILLPFIYFFIKIYYFAPSGRYSGYNETYSLENITPSAIMQYKISRGYILYFLKNNLTLSITLAIFAFLTLRSFSIPRVSSTLKTAAYLVTLGIVILFLGLFPYWILGHVPSFNEWTSRHQILMPLGFSLIIVAAWSYLRGNLVIFSAFVGLSLAINVSTYMDFFVDWQKQKQLIDLFAKDPEIKNAGLIVIDDKTTKMNALGRIYRFYEWNGIFQLAFGDEKRFGIAQSELPRYLEGKYKDEFFNAHYKAGSFKRDSKIPQLNVEINVIEPEGLRERLLSKVSPQLSINITRASLD